MDRSGRCTAVVAWAITVGVMFGGAVIGAVPAFADERGTDSSDTVDVAPHRRAPHSSDAHTVTPPGGVRGRGPTPAPVPVPPEPCLWWCPLPTPAHPPARNAPGGIVVGPPFVPSVTPVPIFGDRRIVIDGLPAGDDSLGLPPLPPPEGPQFGGPAPGSAPAAQGPGVPSALVAPSPVVPPAVPAVAAPPAGPPALNVPDLPAPGLTGPVPAAAAARPAPPSFPEPPLDLPELRPENLGRIASTALPGLAALVGMTIFGGVIGYRQARAGYLLRAAGAGRFLQ